METLRGRVVRGLACTLVIVLARSQVSALTCPSPAGAPTCIAQAGDKVCSGDSSRQCAVNADCVTPQTCVSSGLTTVGVTVTPASGQSITSVTFSGSSNLVTIPASVSGGTDQVVTFRVRQTITTQDDLGIAIVHQTGVGSPTCTVDLTFDYRATLGSTPQSICALSSGYTLDVVSSLPSPAGTTVCASHLANCSDTPAIPAGYDFEGTAFPSRVLSIHSPITGPAVDMRLVRDPGGSSFLPNLRLMYSRFDGSSFPTYDDITYSVVPGSTIIRGTGQWSDVKLVAANSLSGNNNNLVPTVGEWGLIIMSLLLLTASTILLARRRLAAASGPSHDFGPAQLAPRLLVKVLAGIGTLGLLSLAIAARRGFTLDATDVVGSLVSACILTYLLHYWITLARDHGEGGPH